MIKIQGKSIVGYALIAIEGKQPEAFLEYCAKKRIVIWDIQKTNSAYCLAKVSWLQLNHIKQFSEDMAYEVTVKHWKGFLPLCMQKIRNKKLLIACLLSLLLIFALSNIVWKLEVTGVSKEVDMKIQEELKQYGLYPGAWSLSLEDVDVIQQQLLNDIPELLYIGIYKHGTTYKIDAVEKLIEKKEEQELYQQLTATKNGVIQKLFIQSGVAQVHVQDFVTKGDVLVSGDVSLDSNDEETEDKWIGANGKVYANTWYEIDMSIPLYAESEKLTGNKQARYGINIGTFSIPIWGFWQQRFDNYITEHSHSTFNLLSWTLPFSFWEEVIYDKNTISTLKTEEEAKKIAIEHVANDVARQLGSDAEIVNYNVLHESVDSGKVNLNLYISVLEDIAKGQEID